MATSPQRAASYTYTEPHPSLPATARVSTGRGGAGNATRLNATTDSKTATGPVPRSPAASPDLGPRRFSVGRGGAGNFRLLSKERQKRKEHTEAGSAGKGQLAGDHNAEQPVDEPTAYELDTEMRVNAAEALEAQKRIWHYGRGGEGNVLNQGKASKEKESSEQKQRLGSIGSTKSQRTTESVGSFESMRQGEVGYVPGSKQERSGSFMERTAQRLRKGSSEA